jgi:hypothetical protein
MALMGTKTVAGPYGYSRVPWGSFVGKVAAPSGTIPIGLGDLGQLDRGLRFQSVKAFLGPTLGWVQEWVRPETVYSTSPVNLGPKDSVALLNVLSSCVVNLPSVIAWMREPAYNMYSPFERALWIKDISGAAVGNNITIVPFGSQTIDGGASIIINQNYQIIRLYPRNDLTGWYNA